MQTFFFIFFYLQKIAPQITKKADSPPHPHPYGPPTPARAAPCHRDTSHGSHTAPQPLGVSYIPPTPSEPSGAILGSLLGYCQPPYPSDTPDPRPPRHLQAKGRTPSTLGRCNPSDTGAPSGPSVALGSLGPCLGCATPRTPSEYLRYPATIRSDLGPTSGACGGVATSGRSCRAVPRAVGQPWPPRGR